MPYKDKEKVLEYRRTHKLERAEWHRKYYQVHKAEILERNRQYNHLHKNNRTAHYWEYRAQLKIEILKHYGNSLCACVKCGYDKHIEALSIDHINGDGNKHRQRLGIGGGGRPFYVWLKKHDFPEGYQTLCMNC